MEVTRNKPHIKLKSMIGGSVGMAAAGSLAPVASSSFWGYLREPFAGAWQKNIQPEQPQNILAFSAVYSCVSFICSDIAKLRIKLVEQPIDNPDIWVEVRRTSPFLPVLRKPNRYQTRMQFIQQWLASKYLHGNTYVLKDRDARGVVTAMYVLNPFYVQPLIASDGSVFYMINKEWLAGIDSHLTVPASEIIHDRCETLWHPLVGVSPIYACGASATQGIRIQTNSENLFRNLSRPSGHLTSADEISDETALRLKRDFESNFQGGNLGRLLVTGSGLKYEPITMTATDAQLIEQLNWTGVDVARAYKMPLYKIGAGAPPAGASTTQMNQDYYSQTLQSPIEAIELLLDEGLGLPDNYSVALDLDGLMRMDPLTRSETARNFIGSGVWSPNEGRAKENLPPSPGGDHPYMQQQYFSLEALAKRDEMGPAPSAVPGAPGATVPPPPVPLSPPQSPRASDGPSMPNSEEQDNVQARVSNLESAMAEFNGTMQKMLDFMMQAHKDAQKKTLYVSRDVLNGDDLVKWAKSQGFKTTVPADKMHVTLAFSRNPVVWSDMGGAPGAITAAGGKRSVEPLGDGGAVVLKFQSKALTERWKQLCSAGCSWDYEDYHPHVSISWQVPDNFDLTKVTPFKGTLQFGPEKFHEVQEDWRDNIQENSAPLDDGNVIDVDEFHRELETMLLGAPE